MTSTQGPSFLGSLPVATLVSVSPGKQRRPKGRDPREGLDSLFRIDCYQGCWLCDHNHEVESYKLNTTRLQQAGSYTLPSHCFIFRMGYYICMTAYTQDSV